jgi:hypothetical protein
MLSAKEYSQAMKKCNDFLTLVCWCWRLVVQNRLSWRPSFRRLLATCRR